MGLTKPRSHQLQNLDYKQAVRAVSITNVTLAGSAPTPVDGVSLALNDRILVTGQSTASQNGIYRVSVLGNGSNGTWTRAIDADESGDLSAGIIVMVTEGSTYADTTWKLTTNNPITVGSTSLAFEVNTGAGSGTVTSVAVTTANGVSGTVATATTTPAITLTLGSITPDAVQVSGLTASEILSTDASKNLTSLAVATYPSLAELAYVKGVTSAIQTQINAKGTGTVTSVAATVPSVLSITGSPITTTGTLAISYSGTALPVANGGTSLTTLTANNVILGNGASAPTFVAPSTSGNLLTSNGTTWASTAPAASAISLSNDTTTATNVYPTFASATTGTTSTVYTSNAKLLYKPSTGELSVTAPIASNGLVLNATTVATSYTIAAGYNASSVGPITVSGGVAVTITSGQRWLVL